MENSTIYEQHRTIAAVSFVLMGLCGLSINSILIGVFINSRKRLYSSFHKLAFNVALTDFCFLLLILFIAVPCTLTRSPVYGTSSTGILANLDTVLLVNLAAFVLIMTVNRVCAIYPDSLMGGEVLFHGLKIYAWLLLCWLWGFGVAAYTMVSGCPMRFHHEMFMFRFSCQADSDEENAAKAAKAVLVAFPALSMVLHSWTIFQLRCGGKVRPVTALASRRRASDRSLLLQAFTICGFLLLTSLSFVIFPQITSPWASLVLGWMVIINSSAPAVVYWIYNSDIKEETYRFLSCISGRHIEERPASRLRRVAEGIRFLEKIRRAVGKKSRVEIETIHA